jgi:hypothetical protein
MLMLPLQALYYQLRTFLLATRENAMAAVKENKLRQDAAAKAAAARAASGGGASPSVSGAKVHIPPGHMYRHPSYMASARTAGGVWCSQRPLSGQH